MDERQVTVREDNIPVAQPTLSRPITEPTQHAFVVCYAADDMGSVPLGGLVDDPAPVQRFVEKVLGATVTGYINGMAASGSVQEFLGRYNDARRELASKVRAELEAWGVEPGSTSLGSFEAADPKLNKELQDAASAEALGNVLKFDEKNAEIQARIAVTLMKSKLMEASPELWSEVEALGADNVALIRTIEAISGRSVPEIFKQQRLRP